MNKGKFATDYTVRVMSELESFTFDPITLAKTDLHKLIYDACMAGVTQQNSTGKRLRDQRQALGLCIGCGRKKKRKILRCAICNASHLAASAKYHANKVAMKVNT